MGRSSMRARMTALFTLAVFAIMTVACTGLMLYGRLEEEQNAAQVLGMAAGKLLDERREAPPGISAAEFLLRERPDMAVDGLTMWLTHQTSAGRMAPITGSWRTKEVVIGDETACIGMPWGPIERRLWRHTAAIALLGCIVTIGAGFGAWRLIGRTLSPIGALASTAESLQIERLAVQLEAPSSDAEIVGLVGTLNRLLQRIADAAARQGRFYSAASHELRTPLHALSGFLEVGLSRERTAAEYRRTLQEAYTQANCLCDLVQDLLFLTQLQSSVQPPARETINLSEAVQLAIEPFRLAIDLRSLILSTDLSDAEIAAPPSHVQVVVRNLLENAVKYTPDAGAISISLTNCAGIATLTVANDARTIAPQDVSRLHEPFFRPDASRTSSTGGYGLGLAICDALARSNGWSLSLSSHNGTFSASVTLPAGQAVVGAGSAAPML